MTTKFAPKYVTFDCYGTLTDFQMSPVTKEVLGDRLPPEIAPSFLAAFSAYRVDEVLGDWKPYRDVIGEALRRAMAWHEGLEYRDEDAQRIYEEIPNWGPHPDVPDGLKELSARYPLVILSNAADEQIGRNVDKLVAPFHAVLTSEQAQAYKPRLAAFEFLFNELGCGPEDVVHVSSSIRYDIVPARDLKVPNIVYVNRGYGPPVPGYGYTEVEGIDELPALFE